MQQIKPYPVLAERAHHEHYEPVGSSWRTVITVDGKESECSDCCEAITEVHE